MEEQLACRPEAQHDDAASAGHFWDFITDGFNMLIRSATLQVQYNHIVLLHL